MKIHENTKILLTDVAVIILICGIVILVITSAVRTSRSTEISNVQLDFVISHTKGNENVISKMLADNIVTRGEYHDFKQMLNDREKAFKYQQLRK